MTPNDFVNKWRNVTLKERSAAQEHFLDLCGLIGHPTPAQDDPAGERFAFEYGAKKSSSEGEAAGSGWADVYKANYFAWEYKGRHADLAKAYEQLLRYRESLNNPPLLVVSDLDSIIVHTNFTNTTKQVVTLTLDDLLKTEKLAQLRNVFYNPEAFKAKQTTAQVTAEAAREFAKLADILRKWGEPPDKTAHFLIRLLFCLFAEDVDLLEDKLFSRMIEKGRGSSGNIKTFHKQLKQLFEAMATGGTFGVDVIAHFDGGLFNDSTVLELDGDALDILYKVSKMDWGSIEPSILGTLFVRSLDPDKRSQLGAHYTDKDDILLVVEPVLMRPLRRRWAEVKAQAVELAARRDAEKGAKRTKAQTELTRLLTGFAGEIASTTVLDAACGSANFLYVSLRCLLDLEKEVITLAASLGVGSFFPQVGPAQLLGIELNAYAHELAQVTVWIGYIQWLRENGFGRPSEPILKPLTTIRRMDAVMNPDGTEPEWPSATVIVGNPPFLGGNKIRKDLGDKYVDKLFALYDGRVPAFADLVCYWFEKARALVEQGKVKRAGLLATQGIRGGVNRKVLERIKEMGDIFWAQSDREWILNGATVHVSMVCFDDASETIRELDGKLVDKINSDLTSNNDLTQAKLLSENKDLGCYGSQQKGAFDISSETAYRLLSEPNLFGRSNNDVVKRSINASQLMRGGEETWVIDFGLGMPMEEAALYEGPFEYVKKVVYPRRINHNERIQKEYWWLHARPSPKYREILRTYKRYIVTPAVSKHRIFVWLTDDVLADHAIIVFARDDDYFFGVLHSKLHELWARATGTQLREAESGFRYTPSSTFETFPFPFPPGQEPKKDPRVQAIAQAAKTLVEQRDRWLNPKGANEAELKKRTLTNLYNQKPQWLVNAHKALDEAVFAAYGWPNGLSDDEILSRLLVLNLERSSKQQLVTVE